MMIMIDDDNDNDNDDDDYGNARIHNVLVY